MIKNMNFFFFNILQKSKIVNGSLIDNKILNKIKNLVLF